MEAPPRVKKLQLQLRVRNLDALLISSVDNRFYLSGWNADEESGYILITNRSSFILTDSRYTEHATGKTSWFKVIEAERGIGQGLKELVADLSIRRLGFEAEHLSVLDLKNLQKVAKGTRFIATTGLVEEGRSVKDALELEMLRKAAALTSLTFNYILGEIEPGLTEKEIAWRLTSYMREKGAEKNAWEPLIVAAGVNSSMAHYGAGDQKVVKGDMVLLDFGCSLSGYNSDMTRVIFLGKPNKERAKIYELVLQAQEIGISLVKPGIKTSKIDKKVHEFIDHNTKYSYSHSLGHGVGIQVHEVPNISSRRDEKLTAGNVITIEPGVYIPGWGGVRIEDMVAVEASSHQLLTSAPKKLQEVTI